ncbi:phospholipase ABHD3-like isoform X1 [Clytia hemisphaerica]|uniref:phospholipase ABHD3-like isoform X1 n=1 Tax=Clytia hemisphaerica TaxID=252671 RepID=UPI0034D44B76
MLGYIYNSFTNWDYTHVASAVTCSYFLYYFYKVVHRPALVAAEGPYKKMLHDQLTVLKEHFWPTFWAFNKHHQTICRVVFKSKPVLPYVRETLKTKDNGQISLDWVYNDDDNKLYHSMETRPTVIVLPGITGCYDASYVRHIVKEAKDLGYRSLVFNNRGLGRTELKTPRTFCACNVEDLEQVLDHTSQRFPKSPIYIFAVSLGGVILTNYLSRRSSEDKDFKTNIKAALIVSAPWCSFRTTDSLEEPVNWFLYNRWIVNKLKGLVKSMIFSNYIAKAGEPRANIKAALIVSAPWDTFQSTISLEQPFNWLLYNRFLVKRLKELITENMQVFEEHTTLPYDINDVLKASSIREFDEAFTAKTFGFASHKEYYTESSLVLKPLEHIKIPMLYLNARDDPFAPIESIPLDSIKKNPNMAIILTDYGGHIGFVEGAFVRGRSLVERLFNQYFSSISQQSEKKK